MSGSSEDILYVATDKGHILKWNIINGKRVGRWSIRGRIFGIYAGFIKETNEDTIYIVDKSNEWEITAHRFGSGGDPAKTDMAVLVKFNKPIRSLKVVEGGRVLIAMTSDGLLLGTSTTALDGELNSLKYNWKEVKCNETPSCFAVKSTLPRNNPNTPSKKGATPNVPTIDVAVGGVKGSLVVYQDILNQIGQTARTMHWHREAVGAVAWSLDGKSICPRG